jgi:ATP-dependent protease ClpP protease subunit
MSVHAVAVLGRLKRRIAELTAEHTGQWWSRSSPTSSGPLIRRAAAVTYGLADEVIGGRAGAPESGTPA